MLEELKLGQEVEDRVTGFHGVAVARVVFLNGCEQICVKPKMGKDGKMIDAEYIDHGQLRVIGDGVCILPEDDPGGVMPDTPPTNFAH